MILLFCIGRIRGRWLAVVSTIRIELVYQNLDSLVLDIHDINEPIDGFDKRKNQIDYSIGTLFIYLADLLGAY